MDKNNLFYEPNDPIAATVGTNGYHTISDYADGFFEGAEFIIYECCTRLNNRKNISSQSIRKNITEDIIVYPVCFNIRHSIELYLKEIIENIFDIYEAKGLNLFRVKEIEHHDINKLWEVLRNAHFSNWNANLGIPREIIFDNEFDEYINFLDKYITNWGALDPTGQTFRYPFSNESKRHLEDRGVISVYSLFLKSEEFHKKLKEFRNFSYFLKKQYEKGKFAKFFTYKQLISIAKKLPNYFEWRNVDFNNIAAELANIYKVDSLRSIKEMVINEKIKKDYFLSSLIGIDIDFKYISKERLSEFYLFFKNNDTEICSSCKKGSIEDIFIIPEINNSISKLLHTYNEEELLDIVSLMYIGRDNEDIYDYDKIIDHMKMSFSSKDAIINKLLEKRGSMRIYLENSLKIFGKDKLWNL